MPKSTLTPTLLLVPTTPPLDSLELLGPQGEGKLKRPTQIRMTQCNSERPKGRRIQRKIENAQNAVE
jgi:hypothetical protein